MTSSDYALPRSTPEAQGLPSSAILAFVAEADATLRYPHSFMLLRRGHVVAEGAWAPYRLGALHQLFSLSKSFTSTAVGLLVAEGRLSVDDAVLPFFPDAAPARVSRNLAAMRVRHLLTMTTGHAVDTMEPILRQREGHWVKGFLRRPVKFAPGTHFLYNTGATYMLSAIVQKVTGQRVRDYLQPRLFAPLGIDQAEWGMCPRGITVGGWGLNVTLEAIARFGQLYLQRGVWRGQRLLPEAWVEAATAPQADNSDGPSPEWQQGYGYQFWGCRHGAYRGDGAFGQYCVVMPDQEMVLAMNSGLGDMQAPLDLVWRHLLPAAGPAPLPEDRSAQAALAEKVAGLALPLVKGERTSPAARAGSGTYAFPANPMRLKSASFDFSGEADICTLRDALGEHRLACGRGTWVQAPTTLRVELEPPGGNPSGPRVAALSGAWTDAETYTLQAYVLGTPFCLTAAFRFEGDRLTLNVGVNVSFGPTQFPSLEGRRAAQ